MAGLSELHHAALSVRDLDASIGWYRDVLGFEETTFRQESSSRRVVVMRFPGSRRTLGLVQHMGTGAEFSTENLGLDHLAFSVSSAEDLESWAHRLEGHGVSHSGPIETPFGGMLNFADVDGIALALFWERDSSPST